MSEATAVVEVNPTSSVARPVEATPLPVPTETKLEEIKQILVGTDEYEVLKRREVGKLVLEVINNRDIYGIEFRDIEHRLPFQRDVLRQCKDIAAKFTDEQFDRLQQVRTPSGSRLRWSHLTVLTRLESFDSALALALRAAADEMSCRELTSFVQDSQGGPQANRPGRPPATPTDVTSLIKHVDKFFKAFDNKVDRSWRSDDAPDYEAEVQAMSPAAKQQFAQLCRSCIDKFENAQLKLSSLETDLNKLYDYAVEEDNEDEASTNPHIQVLEMQ